MRSWMIGTIAASTLTLAGCEPAAPAVPPGAPVTVVPMKLMQKNVSPPVLLVEIKADGLILGPKGQPLGKINGTKIEGGNGKELLSVGPDGVIKTSETDRKLKFNNDGDLSDEKGLIKIGSDGTVITQDIGTSTIAPPTRTPMMFEGYTPAGHREAEVILVLVGKKLGNVADLGLGGGD